MDAAEGAYAVQKRDGNTWTDLTNDGFGGAWIFSPVISQGQATNVLKARRLGDEIRVYVNGVLLNQLFDNSFAQNGYAGVANWYAYAAAATARARFDDFRMDRFEVVYADDYTRNDSGWYVDSEQVCQAGYVNGLYRTAARPNYVCVYGAPSSGQANGMFEVQVNRGDTFYQTAYGLIFAIEGAFNRFYTFLIIPDTQNYALARYDHGLWTGITFDPVDGDAWLRSEKINPSTAINKLGAERDGLFIRLYVNDEFLGQFLDNSLLPPLTGAGFGVINWSSQFEMAIADFDRYRVTTWEPGESGLLAAGVAPSISRPLTLPDFLAPPSEP